MIVDDAAFMRGMLKDILTRGGHDVVWEAKNGEEAILKYEELKPDIVTMDIIMPGIDGISTVKEIIERDPGAKIVICSALGQEQVVMEAIEAGAREYIVKPFHPFLVMETIAKVSYEN
jgi:two-component system chemotaxis response regulator CheY